MANPKIIDKLLEKGEKIDRRQLIDFLKDTAKENLVFRNTLESLDLGIILLDNNLRIIEINPSAEFLLGVSGKKVIEKRILVCPIDETLLKIFEKALASSENSYKQDLYIRFPREQFIRIMVSAARASAGEEILGWIISFNDITEFSRASTQKVQTEKLKALVTMAGILAHELGNPLNSLSIHLQLVNKAVKAFPEKYGAKISKYLKITQSEVKRLDDIVTRFLQATRPFKPRFFEGDINRILDETLQLMSPEFKRNKISVEKTYSKELPKAYVDHVQIRQAFINIIKNAIEARSKNPRLGIETSVEGSQIKISFTDNGVGIPENELNKIFEPYYSTKRAGSGLGLVIVNRIIRDHGGSIGIKSRLWEGTTFTIYLPTEPAGPKLLSEGKK